MCISLLKNIKYAPTKYMTAERVKRVIYVERFPWYS